MASIVRMPSVLAGAEEATIANWLIAEGDTIAVGDTIAEIETEKAVVDYAAEEAGTVGRIVLEAGSTGAIGVPIVVLLADGEGPAEVDAVLGSEQAGAGSGAEVAGAAEVAKSAETTEAPTAAAPAVTPVATPPVGTASDAPKFMTKEAAGSGFPNAIAGSTERRFASPIARKLAAERNVDITAITGTGPGGRITRRDVDAAELQPSAPSPAAATAAAPSTATASSAAGQPGTQLVPHSAMRKAIARRLTASKATVPHFYLLAECRVDELLALRAQVIAALGHKVSVNDFVIKAVAAAFEEVPEANVTWTDDGMLVHDTVDISVAVATEGGLTTPIVRDVSSRSLSNVGSTVTELAQRARDKRLRQDELEGGSFSVSNLGMYGTVEFSAILNPPQWGILAVGAAKKQPVIIDDEIVSATIMRCTLSVDHRAVDGALAARWLAAFQERIENPLSIMA